MRVLGLLALILIATIAPALAAPPAPTQTTGGSLYLPLLAGGGTPSAGRSSEELIAAALTAGTISAADSLLYNAQAIVGDPALPPRFRGDDTGVSGAATMSTIVAALPTLSPADQARLQPYLARPDAATPPAGRVTPAAVEWIGLTAPGGKAIVWYSPLMPSLAPRAARLANELGRTIWPELTGLMGEPRPDCAAACAATGGNALLDIYLTPTPQSYVVPATCCAGAPAFIVLPPNTTYAQLSAALMHAILAGYPGAGTAEYAWLRNAAATWAIDYVYQNTTGDPDYPETNPEHTAAARFLARSDLPLESRQFKRDYGAYLLLRYIDDPSIIPDLFRMAATTPNSLAAVNAQLGGGFAEQWAQFALENWNRTPIDAWKRLDNLQSGAQPGDEWSLTTPGEYGFPIDLEHLSADYFRFLFPQRNLRLITIVNPLAAGGATTGQLQALLKIGGTWRTPQDWTDLSTIRFCRDQPNEDLEELVLIVSNSEWQERERILNPGDGTVTLSAACTSNTISGAVTWRYTRSIDGAEGAYERYEAEATITFRLQLVDAEQGLYADAGSTYTYSAAMDKLTTNSSGTQVRYRWTEQGSGPAGGAFAYLREGAQPTDGRRLQASPSGLPYRRTGTTTVIAFPGAPPLHTPIDDTGRATVGCDSASLVDAQESPDSVGVFDVACTVFGTSATGQLRLTSNP
jgi:hypothetical protein